MLKQRQFSRMLGLILFFLLVGAANTQEFTQKFAKGRVFLANGLNLEGQDLRLTMEAVTLEIMGQDQTFLFEDVIQVMAKKGKAKQYGWISTASFSGLILLVALTNTEETTETQSGEAEEVNDSEGGLGGLLVVGGISYGVGYLLGHLIDDWQVVYLKRG